MQEESKPSEVDALARLTFAITAHLEASAAGESLSIQQVRLLGILRDREPSINELATHLGVDKSSMSGAVVRAEKRGLVARFQDARDGRSVRVKLTPAGRTLATAAGSAFEAEVARIMATLNAGERKRWLELTLRVLAAANTPSEPSS